MAGDDDLAHSLDLRLPWGGLMSHDTVPVVITG